jgi:hypothetical protein
MIQKKYFDKMDMIDYSQHIFNDGNLITQNLN